MIYTVLSSLTITFALAIPGIIFSRLKMADPHQLKLMSGFLLKVVLPAVIIYSMQMEFSSELLKNGLMVFAAVFYASMAEMATDVLFLQPECCL